LVVGGSEEKGRKGHFIGKACGEMGDRHEWSLSIASFTKPLDLPTYLLFWIA